jgi:L-asparaginase
LDNIIINTGGTFNKVYNSSNGELDVPLDNKAIENIFKNVCRKNNIPKIKGIIYKDSLEIDDKDRKSLLSLIESLSENKILIVHGTDTIDITAKFLASNITNKKIVLTGAMIPFSIDKTEAVGNLMQGYGFLQSNIENGVFISMNGFVRPYEQIKKNKNKGVFECQ